MKETVILPIDPKNISENKGSKTDLQNIETAADILKRGGIVAIPTETVYGLAANALDPNAVKDIFKAKGRPQDNPLIVHISSFEMMDGLLAEAMPLKAKKLADKFWPGPLTMIFKKSDIVPNETSGGLDTVAIRFPSHPIAHAVIENSNLPIAAPSANLSGKPSPTTAQHCIDDLTGKVDAIIDGGSCGVGIESTVLSFAENPPILLRPGAVTAEMISEVIGDINIHEAVYSQLTKDEKATSPGMKYKHYAPEANLILIEADSEKFAEYVNEHADENTYAMCFDEDKHLLKTKYVSYGSADDDDEQGERLFEVLRHFNDIGADKIYAHCPKKTGVALAVYNRIVRAAAYQIIKL